MRCALSFDENKDFAAQNLAAWGEMQSTSEEPSYREEDIRDKWDMAFFRGVKVAMDSVSIDLINLVEDGELTQNTADYLLSLISGELAMHLFSILDNQEE